MRWNKYTIATTTAAVDLISSALNDCGIEGIEIEDNVQLSRDEIKTMFVDFIPELPPDDGSAKVSFYLDADADNDAVLEAVVKEIEELRTFIDIGSGQITISQTEDKDWINNWKEFFKPFTVDELLIKPTWEEIPPEHKDKLLIQIDPGTAFGTGKHETTQLCIRQLRKYVTKESLVLDVGTGSGILGISALVLGAKEVWGTDLDENAVTAVLENLEANRIPPEKFHVIQGNIIDDKRIKDWAGYGKYDLVVANILAPVIILLQKEIAAHMKPGGLLITSGILDQKENAVMEAFLANSQFEVAEVTRQGEWVSITARKR